MSAFEPAFVARKHRMMEGLLPMRTDDADPQSPADADHVGNGRAHPGFWSTMAHSTARLFELEARIILLQLLQIMRRAMMRAVWVAVGALLLLAGAVFLYIAIFQALLMVMPVLAVWVVFAGVHLLAGALILVWAGGKTAEPRSSSTSDCITGQTQHSAKSPDNAPPVETLP
ncbi:MAG: phage holin family protein [Phycisphaerae bacterium]